MKLFHRDTKSVSPADCAVDLLEVVPAIMRAIRTRVRASSSELSVPHFRTLGFLSRRRGSSLSELAEHIGLSLPSASKIVQLLIVRGYLRRKTDESDRRRTVLAPTAKGERVLGIARRSARDFLAGLIETLDGDQRRQVSVGMDQLRSIFIPELSDARNGRPPSSGTIIPDRAKSRRRGVLSKEQRS